MEDVVKRVRDFWGDETIYGIPIGGLLTQPIISTFRDNQLNKLAEVTISDYIIYLYNEYIFDLRIRIERFKNLNIDVDQLKNRHIFYVPVFFQKDLALLYPIAKQLGKEQTVFLSGRRRLIPNLSQGFSQVNLYHFTYGRKNLYRKLSRQIVPLKRRVKDFVCREGWGKKAEWLIESAIVNGINMALRWDMVFEIMQPKSLTVLYDYHPSAFVGVMRARAKGVHSLTLQHGIIGSTLGFIPLAADHVAVWGKETKDFYLAQNTSPERVFVGGCPRLNRSLEIDPGTLMQKIDGIGWPVNRRDGIIVLTNRITGDIDYQWIKSLKTALLKIKSHPILIKCHPAESAKPYYEIFEGIPNVFIASGEQWTLDEALALGNITTTLYSGAGLDALFKGKYLVIYNPFSDDLASLIQPVNSGAALYSQTADEWVRSINLLLHDPLTRNKAEDQLSKWRLAFCAYSSIESAEKIASFIRANYDD